MLCHPTLLKSRYGVIIPGLFTVNVWLDVAVPPAVVREIVPVVVPDAGVAVTVVEFTFVKDAAAVPLNFTDVVPVRLVTVIVTNGRLHEQPEVGVKLVMVGVPCAFTSRYVTDSTKNKHTRTMTELIFECSFIYCSFIYPPYSHAVQHETTSYFLYKSISDYGWGLIKNEGMGQLIYGRRSITVTAFSLFLQGV